MKSLIFRKEIGEPKGGMLYRSVARPEFTVCAKGLEWALGYVEGDKPPEIGDEVIIEVTGHKLQIRECFHCGGAGKVKR